MKKPKLVHIIWSLGTGGAEKLLVDLALNLKDSYELTVISQFGRGGFPNEEILEKNAVRVIYLNKRTGFDLKAVFDLYKTLSAIKPDIVHTHIQASAYAIFWYITHPKAAKFHTVHSVADRELGKVHQKAQAFAYACLGVVPIAISPAVKESLVKTYGLGAENIPLIHNGIDTSEFARPRAARGENAPFELVQVASFNKWKNQIFLLRAFARALEQEPDMHLTFVGDGPELAAVKSAAEKLGIRDKALFAGSSAKVAEFLRRADAFVLSSTFEGLPLAVLEAYAAGLPVISTRVGGVPDMLTDGENGLLVPSGDEAAMSAAILKLRANRGLCAKMGEANRKKAEEFDIKTVSEAYKKLYCLKSGEKDV